MRVVIAVATANAALRAYLAGNRTKVVPPEAVAKGYLRDKGARFSVQLHAADPTTEPDELGEWLASLSGAADGLILLIDEDLRFLVSEFEDAYFIAGLADYPGSSLQNHIRSTLTPILRHFSVYSQRFDDLGNQRVLLLPLEVFRAADLDLLRARLTRDKMEPGFGQHLDELIKALNRRRNPKTKTRFRTVYLVDDRPLWYRYGPEQHKIVETDVPPHHQKCWHDSRFRFGRLYNDRLHHNVDDDSEPTKVSGDFSSCHGQTYTAKGESHLNVFPNGQI